MRISNMKLEIDLTHTQLQQLRFPLKWYWLIRWQTLETKKQGHSKEHSTPKSTELEEHLPIN